MDLQKFLKKSKFPVEDCRDFPPSKIRFSDRCHYRIEVAGIERLSVLEALIDEMKHRKVPVHRIVGPIMGAMMLTKSELHDFVEKAMGAGIHVLATIGPRPSYDIGGRVRTPEGVAAGSGLRGMDHVVYGLKDALRAIEAGVAGFNITDSGILLALSQMKTEGLIPKETVLKASVGLGGSNPFNIRVLEMIGADSINPVGDLTVSMLATLRSVTELPFSIFISSVDSSGGFVRFHEAADIARCCSPVYLKIEPGESLSQYKAHKSVRLLEDLAREKVRQAQLAIETIEESDPHLKCSK